MIEVSMNKDGYTTKSFFPMTLPYRSNSSTWKQIKQKKIVCFVSWFTAICSFYNGTLWSTCALVTDWIGPMDKTSLGFPSSH